MLFSRLLAFRSLLSDSLLIRVSSSGSILEFSLPSLATQSSVALAAFLGSVYPVHLSLLALFARPLLPFLSFLGFCSMGLLLSGPLLGLCRGPYPLLGGSLFQFGVFSSSGVAPSSAALLVMLPFVVGASTHSGLTMSLGVLLFRRFSLLLLVVIAGPPPLLWLFCGGPVWLQLLHQLWSHL